MERKAELDIFCSHSQKENLRLLVIGFSSSVRMLFVRVWIIDDVCALFGLNSNMIYHSALNL